MDISSITSASAGTNFLDPKQAIRTTGKQVLDVNDFLKLITVQLTSQDPMKPMEDTQFISQMANFTSLEQMRTLSKNFDTFTSDQRISSAENFLGRIVTVSTAAGEVPGEVTAVTLADGTPRLTIGAGSFDPADVTSITAKPASTASAATSTISSGPTAPPATL